MTILRSILFISLWGLCCAPIPAVSQPAATELVAVTVRQFHMGMMVYLTVYAPTKAEGQAACKKAFFRIREVNALMSDYNPRSELSKLCRQAGKGPVVVSPELYKVLARAKTLAEQSGGKFDPTAAPLIRLWREARKSGTPPSPEALAEAQKRVGHQQLLLDPKARTAELKLSGMQLDLGGIAKGFAGDEALRVLIAEGIRIGAYEAGGETVYGDAPPGSDGWPLLLPRADGGGDEKIYVKNCAVSVSGDSRQFLEANGKRYSHVIDPASGEGVSHGRSCVVIARSGLDSDPLSTLGTLMDPEAYEPLMKQHYPKIRYILVPAQGGGP